MAAKPSDYTQLPLEQALAQLCYALDIPLAKRRTADDIFLSATLAQTTKVQQLKMELKFASTADKKRALLVAGALQSPNLKIFGEALALTDDEWRVAENSVPFYQRTSPQSPEGITVQYEVTPKRPTPAIYQPAGIEIALRKKAYTEEITLIHEFPVLSGLHKTTLGTILCWDGKRVNCNDIDDAIDELEDLDAREDIDELVLYKMAMGYETLDSRTNCASSVDHISDTVKAYFAAHRE